MSFPIHAFAGAVQIAAGAQSLLLSTTSGTAPSGRESWPAAAIAAPGGWRTMIEVEQLLELGFAELDGNAVSVPYVNFAEIADQMQISLTQAWTKPSPFLLRIDRKSDIGHPSFLYKYQFLLAGLPVYGQRLGYYFKRAVSGETFHLDAPTFSLVQAMDGFNDLPPAEKTPQRSWLTFAHIKGFANDIGASLDLTLQKNEVVIPSSIGLDISEHEDGSLSFLPKCSELSTQQFQQVFERNSQAERLYSLDKPGSGKVRIVLTDAQHEVLRRMKQIRRVRGEVKDQLKKHPEQVFEGVMDDVELPLAPFSYGGRVVGIGYVQFASSPRKQSNDLSMSGLWSHDEGGAGLADVPSDAESQQMEPAYPPPDKAAGEQTGTAAAMGVDPSSGAAPGQTPETPAALCPGASRKVLLILTNEENLDYTSSQSAQGGSLQNAAVFERPEALLDTISLKPHQEDGVRWLQTCVQTTGRKGVVLADDMGLGKTLQILTFLAWCIETGRFPDVARAVPPFRPILIVGPLILLENQTWEREMERFFANNGSLFWPVDHLHGARINDYRRPDVGGSEFIAQSPTLDLSRLQRNRVIITNYETVKNYQYSFAFSPEGKSLWSAIISDEAQEFKIPGTKISHAMKTLQTDFQIACTGTPVENRLLDLWNLYDVVQPGLLDSAKQFKEKFEDRLLGVERSASLDELKQRLLIRRPNAFLLRRNKSELAGLPKKEQVPIKCAMSQVEIDLHQKLVVDLRSSGGQLNHLAVLQRFAQLYQHPALLTSTAGEAPVSELLAQSSKLRAVIEKLHQIRAKREKAIIFSRHLVMQSILAKVLQAEFGLPVKIINGTTKSGNASSGRGRETRNSILKAFQEKTGFHVLVLSPFVAGVGLTITEANHVFHYGRWWNPAVEAQATDRAYRIGQTKDVFVYIPILHDPTGKVPLSFDERLDTLMSRKARDAEDFLAPVDDESSAVTELFQSMASG